MREPSCQGGAVFTAPCPEPRRRLLPGLLFRAASAGTAAPVARASLSGGSRCWAAWAAHTASEQGPRQGAAAPAASAAAWVARVARVSREKLLWKELCSQDAGKAPFPNSPLEGPSSHDRLMAERSCDNVSASLCRTSYFPNSFDFRTFKNVNNKTTPNKREKTAIKMPLASLGDSFPVPACAPPLPTRPLGANPV